MNRAVRGHITGKIQNAYQKRLNAEVKTKSYVKPAVKKAVAKFMAALTTYHTAKEVATVAYKELTDLGITVNKVV